MKSITLIAAIAVTTIVVPVAQAGNGFQGSPHAIDRAVAARQAELRSSFQGSPDAIDRAVAIRQAEQAAAFDTREHAQLRVPRPMPDLVERTALSHERNSMPDLSSMPDVIERTALAGQLQYQPVSTTESRFDWSDFGIGAGAGISLVIVLAGLGYGAWVARQGQRQASGA